MGVDSGSRLVLLVTFVVFTFALTVEAQNCPEKWVEYAPGNTCLYLSQEKGDFVTAISECKSLGAKLVKITDGKMDAFLYSKIQVTKLGHYIGLNDRKQEGKYKWNDEFAEADYVNWEPGQPNNGVGQDCVTLRDVDGKWNDSPCYEHKRFICQKPPMICPTEWIKYYPGNKCIYLSKNSRNFVSARSMCESLDAKLVKIQDSKKDAFLYGKIKNTNLGHYIGLNDRKVEGNYMWNDESSQPDYLNWEPGQPNNGVGQDCVTLRNVDGKWNDSPCYEWKRFICERDPLN